MTGLFEKKILAYVRNTACSKEEPGFLDIARFQFEEGILKVVAEARQEFWNCKGTLEYVEWGAKWMGHGTGETKQ